MVNRHIHVLDHVEICNECKEAGCDYCDWLGGWIPGWYFWNEVWMCRYGPYKSKEEAIQGAVKYANTI